jgi:hypothetical protein
MYNIPICINYRGMLLTGYAYPVQASGNDSSPSLQIFIQEWYLGILSYTNEKWTMDQPIDPEFVNALGHYIYSYMHSVKKAMRYSVS